MDREAREEGSSSQNASISVLSIKESPVGYKYALSDGTSFFIVASRFYNRNIQSGNILSDADLEYLTNENSFYHAYRQALRFLEIRDHSSYELSVKLRRKGYSAEAAANVCADLEKNHYLDDRKFAENFLLSLMRRKNASRLVLARKLAEKGIPREIADELLDKAYTDEDSFEAVKNSAEKLMRKKGISREKLIQSLLRKGFCYSDINEYIKDKDVLFNNE